MRDSPLPIMDMASALLMDRVWHLRERLGRSSTRDELDMDLRRGLPAPKRRCPDEGRRIKLCSGCVACSECVAGSRAARGEVSDGRLYNRFDANPLSMPGIVDARDDLIECARRYLHGSDGMLEVFDERRQLIRSWGGSMPPKSLAECIRIALELPTIQEYLRVVTVLPMRKIVRAWDRDGLIDFEGAEVYRGVRYRKEDELWVRRG